MYRGFFNLCLGIIRMLVGKGTPKGVERKNRIINLFGVLSTVGKFLAFLPKIYLSITAIPPAHRSVSRVLRSVSRRVARSISDLIADYSSAV